MCNFLWGGGGGGGGSSSRHALRDRVLLHTGGSQGVYPMCILMVWCVFSHHVQQTSDAPKSVCVGTLCLAQFTDRVCYRARVSSVHQGKLTC